MKIQRRLCLLKAWSVQSLASNSELASYWLMTVFVWGLVAGVLACIAFVMVVKRLTALQIAILYCPLPEYSPPPEEDENGKQQTHFCHNSSTARLFAKWSKPDSAASHKF